MSPAHAPEAEVELVPHLSSPRTAREFSAHTAAVWGLPIDAEALDMVVSELVTNAVVHGDPPVVMRLRRLPSGVRVEVHDAGDWFPPLVPHSTSGSHGLRVVAALTRDWGVEPLSGGKVVWCELREELRDEENPGRSRRAVRPCPSWSSSSAHTGWTRTASR